MRFQLLRESKGACTKIKNQKVNIFKGVTSLVEN